MAGKHDMLRSPQDPASRGHGVASCDLLLAIIITCHAAIPSTFGYMEVSITMGVPQQLDGLFHGKSESKMDDD